MPVGIPRIFLRGSNIPPVAIDDELLLSTYMGEPLNIKPLLNDEDPDDFPGLPLAVWKYDQTSFDGSQVTIDNSKTTLTYTPKVNYFGIDIFTYQATDGLAASNTATVKLSVICKPPVITPKDFNLKPNTTYILDIKNPYSSPDIKFLNNKPDRDVNKPEQEVTIKSGSINASPDIDILSNTSTTITFRTKPLGSGYFIGVGSFLNYDIVNSVCGKDQNGGGGGSTQDPSTRVKQGWLGEQVHEENVPQVFTKYPMFSRATKTYPYDNEGWFVFCTQTYSAIDQFYISMVTKPYKNNSGDWVVDKYFKGLIGPIGDSLNEGQCRFLFWHPLNTNLDIWGCTPTSDSWYDFGCVQLYRPNITDVNDPARFFTDINTPPTDAEILTCLNHLGLFPFNTTRVNITNTYTGTSRPPFIAP
jgi:hypothetical protein